MIHPNSHPTCAPLARAATAALDRKLLTQATPEEAHP
jgi:hypothetical protein